MDKYNSERVADEVAKVLVADEPVKLVTADDVLAKHGVPGDRVDLAVRAIMHSQEYAMLDLGGRVELLWKFLGRCKFGR